jgi:outer membrane protein OmpA-like peptidoglycan-associated protein
VHWRRILPWLLFASLVPATGLAQATGSVDLRQYHASPFSNRYFRVDGTEVLPAWKLRIGVDLDYAWKPLVLEDVSPSIQTSRKTTYDLIQHAIGADLMLAAGIAQRFEVGLVIPLTVFQTGESPPPTATAPSKLGVANPRVGAKARLWGRDTGGPGVGASVVVSIPTGVGGQLVYNKGPGGEARAFADYRKRLWNVGASIGFRVRETTRLYDIDLGNELTYGVAGELRPLLRTSVLAELAGATAAGSPFSTAKQSPVEALVGVRHRIGPLWFTLAAGPGLRQGYGSPLLRAVAAVAWSNAPPDADRDGIPDDDDRCPFDPEDKDGFEDKDGCPDPDNDKDGILDAADKCPDDPEDFDKFEDGDGCPDPDNDKDRILDINDKCPDKPETYNGFEDEDGCPDGKPTDDRDKDGIPDETDECPDEPEDKDGFEDEDGCPDPDNDKDGIPDVEDKCPNEPETINGKDDEDGCPDKGEGEVRIGKEELETLRPIFFETDRSRVRHAFYNILGQVALTLKAHPEIGRCAVEGHTDDTGPPEWNQKLSLLRAEAVVEFLVARGVDRKRLAAIGHGEKAAWASNQTPWGRAKNRRVIFHIEGVNVEEEKKQESRKRVRARKAAAQERAKEERAKDERAKDERAKDEQNVKPTPPPPPPKPAPAPKPTPAPTPAPAPAPKPAPTPAPAPPPKSAPAPAPKPAAEPAPAPKTSPAPAAPAEPKPPVPPVKPTTPTPPPKGKAPAATPEKPATLRDLLKLPPRQP